MPYQKLFNLVQSGDCYTKSLSNQICEKKLHAHAQDIAGKTVKHVAIKMDRNIWRGIYCSASEVVHETFGIDDDIILTAEGLTEPWERFIFTKELMHIFEPSGLNNDARLVAMLNQITNPTNPFSGDMVKETDAFYLALGVLCNDADRRNLMDGYRGRVFDYKDVGIRLNLPEERMFHYFSGRYPEVLAKHGAIIGD